MKTMNVLEPWTIYDSIVICSNLYGNEQSIQGWFTNWVAFGQQQEHRFFKSRNEAMTGLAYNNMQSQDRSDFAFHAISIGLSLQGPSQCYDQGTLGEFRPPPLLNTKNFFEMDLPNHIGVEFRLAQDVRLSASPYHMPPGYGPRASGVSQGLDELENVLLHNVSNAVAVATQGEPTKENRFYFESAIEIPRNETFEVRITLSEYARRILVQLAGPLSYVWGTPVGGEVPVINRTFFPARYVIQCAIHGLREVQQRGALTA